MATCRAAASGRPAPSTFVDRLRFGCGVDLRAATWARDRSFVEVEHHLEDRRSLDGSVQLVRELQPAEQDASWCRPSGVKHLLSRVGDDAVVDVAPGESAELEQRRMWGVGSSFLVIYP